MFRIVRDPIDQPILALDTSAGAIVTFDGRVRAINEGQRVEALEYEGMDTLAVKEGERILAEAVERFPISAAAGVHRVGLLQLGEVAIRVEVAAGHRREAFEACEFIVDEVKRRVPIWKKEHYADGATDWINAQGTRMLTPEAFYRRQTCLPEVGDEGQRRLSSARVLVVGAGGLGCPAILYLAAAGVGHLGIADGDLVEPSNLHRQPLYQANHVGTAKVHVAVERARSLNPFIAVQGHARRIDSANAESVLGEYDLVLDCSDNFRAKFLLNATCIRLGKPLVSASIDRFEGQLFTIDPGGPCLRCYWPDAPDDGCVGSCEDEGVLGYVPGAVGTLQAGEAIKVILNMPRRRGRVTFIDLRDLRTTELGLPRREDCPICGSGEKPEAGDSIFVTDLSPTDLIIDIREPHETLARPLEGARQMPQSTFDAQDEILVEASRVVLVCAKGIRSAELARRLRSSGMANVYSFDGGVSGIRTASHRSGSSLGR